MINRADLRSNQWCKLRRLLDELAGAGGFYSEKFRQAGVTASAITSLEEFTTEVPFTLKHELLADRLAHPPYGTNFTRPMAEYTRFCQTSGTSSGQPMAWLDTPESWEAMLKCWRRFYQAAGLVKGQDVILFAFAFGPFLGFWTAFEAAADDFLALPCGGLSSEARLELIARHGVTTLCCTPTYAMRLGEMIGTPGVVNLAVLKVNKLIVAGEPGGSIPEVRARLQKLWNARVFDHHGMTEIGPISYEQVELPGSLVVIEDAYFPEVLDPDTGLEVAEDGCGELVLTNLDRTACPLLRYRTGDWVCKRTINGQLTLKGGVLGRVDDMVVVRGVNIYPTAIESIVRQFPEIVEFMVEQRKVEAMDEIILQVETELAAPADLVKRLETRLRNTFSMRIPVIAVPAGSLPRFEFKAKRWRKV